MRIPTSVQLGRLLDRSPNRAFLACRVAAAGEAGQASALVCNTVCAAVTFWMLWTVLAPQRGVGVAAAAWRLCQVLVPAVSRLPHRYIVNATKRAQGF